MADYLLDSDVLINHLRFARDFRMLLPSQQAIDSAGCSVVSVAEVYSGMRLSEQVRTRSLIESLLHYPLDFQVAELAAQLKREYQSKGISLALDDLFIGATALIHNLTLVTGNARHYPMVNALIHVQMD